MQMSIVTLIFKKISRQDIRNYRHISLLCTDYKIIAKALAERMKLVLPSIIHEDQIGFLKDRYIGENITIFLDVQEYLLKSVKPGLAFLASFTAEITSIPNYCYHACHGQPMANQPPSLTSVFVCFINHLPQTILTQSQPSVNGREI
jgi:hypothetical protein